MNKALVQDADVSGARQHRGKSRHGLWTGWKKRMVEAWFMTFSGSI